MWHEAKANEKRIKELMVDHKRRAERRRAFYESRLGDPRQLLRVIGSSCKLYPDAEQYYYHENTDNLMPWQGNTEIKIDRFDGRSLLDYVPEATSKKSPVSKEELDMLDELNFERYHDLVEMERLKVYEEERLSEVESEWNKLLDRHKALLAMLNNNDKKSDKSQNFYAYDYGKNGGPNVDDLDNEQESQLLKEADILQYIDDLTDKDRKILNEMAEKYGIHNYGRLLRMAKKDRDDQLRDLKGKQNKDNNGSSKSKDRGGNSSSGRRRSREDRRRHRRSRYRSNSPLGRRRDPYSANRKNESSDSETSVEETHEQSDVVIEFGSTAPVEQEKPSDSDRPKTTPSAGSSSSTSRATISTNPSRQPEPPKKLTPMEKLKLKMRAGLEKQIQSEEREKRWREREQELERIRGTYKESERGREKSPGGVTENTSKKPARRYYSPSSSSAGSRSPSPNGRRSRRSPSSSLSSRDSEFRKRRRSSSGSRSKRRRRSDSRSPEHRSSRRRSRSRRRSSPDSRRKRDFSRSRRDSSRSKRR